MIAPKLKFLFPGLCEDAEYKLVFTENKKSQLDLDFNRRSNRTPIQTSLLQYFLGLVVLAFAAAVASCYLFNKHWLANNIIGLCFAIQVNIDRIISKNRHLSDTPKREKIQRTALGRTDEYKLLFVQGVQLLSLPNYKTGCMLLGGLFFYDVFWVFGTDVMVTVAKVRHCATRSLLFKINDESCKMLLEKYQGSRF